MGTIISSENMRQAVFGKGFNPFVLGLAPSLGGLSWSYDNWKPLVARDTSDWNVCEPCMAQLGPYITGTPEATGVTRTIFGAHPFVDAMALAVAEKKYQATPEKETPSARPKWWQFWKG